MSKINRLLRKDFGSLSKEKTYISILILQIILFSTARSFTAGVILISDPDQAASIFDLGSLLTFGVLHNNTLTDSFSSKNIEVLPFIDESYGIRAVENGDIDMFVVTPDDLGILINSPQRIVVDVYYSKENRKKDLGMLLLKSSLNDFKKQIQGLRSSGENVYLNIMNADLPGNIGELEMLYTFTLPLLLLFSVIISGSLVIDLITEELERKTFQKLIQTPISLREIFISKSLLPAILTIVTGFFWLTIFMIQGIVIQNIIPLILFLFFISLIYCSIGLLVSIFFKRNKNSQTIYTVVILLSLFFITSTSTSYLPAFIVADLAMESGFDILPLAMWGIISMLLYLFALLVSPRMMGEIS